METEAKRANARKRSGATRRSATQEAILRAADDLLREVRQKGGSAAFITVRQIAQRAAVSASSVYNHFPAGVGSIALQLMERSQALGRPVDQEIVALARMEQARVMAGKDVEARVRAELSFLHSRDDADRARELMRSVDEDKLSHELRFLTRYAVADTIEDMLPDVRDEMLQLTAEAEALAATYGAPYIERQIMRDYRVNALMSPVGGVVDGAAADEAVAVLRESSQAIRRYGVQMTHYGWRYDAACRDFIANTIEMRSVTDEHELRRFFGGQITELVESIGPAHGDRTRDDNIAVEEIMEALLVLEAIRLIDKAVAVELFAQLQGWFAARDEVRAAKGLSAHRLLYDALNLAASVLRGERKSSAELTLDELVNFTARTVATRLASAQLPPVAIPIDASWPAHVHRYQRELPHVRFELFEPEAAIFENVEVRRRVAAIVDECPRAEPGFTETRPGLLEELEALARRALDTGRPLTPAAREHLTGIWNLVG